MTTTHPAPSAAGAAATVKSDADRVVVTGLGVVSALGIGLDAFAAALRAGASAAGPITAFDTTGYAHSIGCEVTDFVPSEWISTLEPDDLGRASQFSVAAARMAVEDAQLSDELAANRVLISMGTTDGESRDLDALVGVRLNDGPGALRPQSVRRTPAGRLSASIAHELALPWAEAVTIPTACAAGNYAIGYGFDAVRFGEVDFALCGGADALCRKTFTGFYRLGTIASERCQPFDVDREGILTGEGAGVLVLERLDSALARGAHIYVEVLGYGLNCDADHQVAPNQDSVARCMQLALDDAGVKPDEVDLVSAHGTGTKANDVTESRAIRKVYGDHRPRVVSMKSMLGHSMGAASALAAIGCAVAIEHEFVPPTINHHHTDPECDVDCVPNHAETRVLDVVQNNGLAFGGNNSVVVFGRYPGAAQLVASDQIEGLPAHSGIDLPVASSDPKENQS